ncbi:MAG: hypothetical protein RMJ84_12410 [Sandaracinaceae bacterium]|nr:hypothetical protein [Sandaracinaceae bacterium]
MRLARGASLGFGIHHLVAPTLIVGFTLIATGCPSTSTSTDAPFQPDGAGKRCSSHDECVIVPASCCGDCGAATVNDFLGVHRDDVEAVRMAACRQNPGCPECIRSHHDAVLFGRCTGDGRCTGINVLELPWTACTDNSDCELRSRDCCACGLIQPEHLIAINKNMQRDASAFLCGRPPEQDVACLCAQTFPPNHRAACVRGRCVVERAP